jgi:hypothetical protein
LGNPPPGVAAVRISGKEADGQVGELVECEVEDVILLMNVGLHQALGFFEQGPVVDRLPYMTQN